MQRWNVKPSRPAAIMSLIIGLGILVFGLTSARKFTPFLIFWAFVVVAIVGFNVWSAFSSRGGAYSIQAQSEDDAPAGRRGGVA